MTDFVTWSYLATSAGAIVMTTLITQFIKGIGFIDKIPTRITSWVVALIILVAAFAFTGVTGIGNYALCIFNAVVVSLASNGTHDALNENFGKGANNDTSVK